MMIYSTLSGRPQDSPELAPSDGFLAAVRGVFFFRETEAEALATIANYVFGLRPDYRRDRPTVEPGQGGLQHYADLSVIVRLPGGVIAVELSGKVKESGEITHRRCFGLVLPIKKDARLIESIEQIRSEEVLR